MRPRRPQSRSPPEPCSAGDAFYEARDALVLLGYSVSEAEGGLAGSAGAAEERVRHALAALGARA